MIIIFLSFLFHSGELKLCGFKLRHHYFLLENSSRAEFFFMFFVVLILDINKQLINTLIFQLRRFSTSSLSMMYITYSWCSCTNH